MNGILKSDRIVATAALLVAGVILTNATPAQEPSSVLKKADAAYRAGQVALAHNDLSAAQADFELVVQLAPQAEQGYSALGAVLVSRGQTKVGIHELEMALSLKDTDSVAQTNLAMAYEQVGLPEKAIPLFAKLETDAHLQKRTLPSYVLASYAHTLAAVRKTALAEAKMRAALAQDEQSADLHDELGSLYAQQRDWPEAQAEFATAVRLNPKFAVAYMHLGLAMNVQSQNTGSEELVQASRLAPQNAAIELELGRTLATSGRDDEAIGAFRRVLTLEPNSIEAAYQLALALQRSNQVDEAISLMKKVIAAEPNNAEAMTNLGMALSQAQLAKDAVPVLQRSVALAPKNVTAHQNLAAAYVQLNQFSDAVTELHEALGLAPEMPQLHYDLGLALKMEDDAAGAIPELEVAQRLDSSAPEAPYLLGVLYMQTGRYEDAAREMKTSLTLRPQNGDGWATLGSVYEKLNELPEATAALQESIRQMPNQPDPHLTLATVLAKQNQSADAAAERKKAAELMRNNMNRQRAEVATNAGNAQLRSGDVNGAITQFRDALSFDANYAEAHLGLASALELQGKTLEAAAERRRAEDVKTEERR